MMRIIENIKVVKQYEKSLKLILLWNLLFCLGFGVYSLLNNLYLKEVVSDLTIGGIVGAYYLSYAIFSFLSGIISDRMGSRKTIMIGLFILFFGCTGGALLENIYLLYFCSVITGIGHAFTNVIFVPLLTEYSNQEERKSLFNIAFASGTFFIFLGTLGAGLLAHFITNYFDTNIKVGIRITLIIGNLLGTLSIIPLLRVGQKFNQQKSAGSAMRPKADYSGSKGVIGKYGVSRFFEGFGVGMIIPFVNLFFTQRFHVDTTVVSLVISIATLATVFMMLNNAKVTQRLGEVKAIILYQTIVMISIFVMSLTLSIWLATFCFLFFRTMYYSVVPIASKIIMERINPSIKGFTSSIGSMCLTIGTSLASPLGRGIVAQYGNYKGYSITVMITIVALIISTISFYSIIRKKKEMSNMFVILNKNKRKQRYVEDR
jgi:MFS family permease